MFGRINEDLVVVIEVQVKNVHYAFDEYCFTFRCILS